MIKTEAERQSKLWWFYTLAMLLSAAVLFTAPLARLSVMFYRRYLLMLVWAVMTVAAYRREYKLRSVCGLGLVFLGWYVLTRWLQGDLYLNPSYNNFIEFCAAYGLALPFAALSREGERRRAFDILALLLVILAVFLAAVSLVCAGKGTDITVFGLVFSLAGGQLRPLGLEPGVAAALLNMGLFLLVYLLACYPRKWLLVPGLILALGIFAAGSLTGSRAAIVGQAAALAILVCLWAARIPVEKRGLRAGLLVLVFAVSMLAFAGLSHAAARGITGLSAEETAQMEPGFGLFGAERESEFSELMEGMRDKPLVWLIGSPDAEVKDLMGDSGDGDLHSSFFQTLALTGLPGLLMVLALCALVLLAAGRLLLDEKKALGQRLLPLVMIALLIQGLMESILFVPRTSMGPAALVNFVFLVTAGCTAEAAGGLCFKGFRKKNP